MHKKLHLMLLTLVLLAGVFLFIQIKRATEITVKQSTVSLISPNATFIPLSNSELVFGNPGAAITVVEFVDFDCATCLTLDNTIRSFIAEHPQDIRLIWKDAPQPKLLTKNLALAHQAAWCAGQQDEKKFWQFVDIAGQNTNNLQEAGLRQIAQGLNLNTDAWWLCTTGSAAQQQVSQSLQLANSLGIKKLPAIFINNKLINTEADINITDMLNSFIAE